MKIIAFSGLSRTGKTTAVNELAIKYKSEWNSVLIYPEVAQIYLDKHDTVDKYEFQKFIVEEEKKRLIELKRRKKLNDVDVILIDRTILDLFVYSYWRTIKGYINDWSFLSNMDWFINNSKELYDEIYFFDTMLIRDENFDDYNCEEIKNLFINTFKTVYWDKLEIYPNFKSFK